MKGSRLIIAHVVNSQSKQHLSDQLRDYLKGDEERNIYKIPRRMVRAGVAEGIAILLRREVVVMAREGLDAAESAGIGLSVDRKERLAEAAAKKLIEKGALFAAACAVRQFDLPSETVERLKPMVLGKIEQARLERESRARNGGKNLEFRLIDHKDPKPSKSNEMAKLTRFSFLCEQHGQLKNVMEVFRISEKEIRRPDV